MTYSTSSAPDPSSPVSPKRRKVNPYDKSVIGHMAITAAVVAIATTAGKPGSNVTVTAPGKSGKGGTVSFVVKCGGINSVVYNNGSCDSELLELNHQLAIDSIKELSANLPNGLVLAV